MSQKADILAELDVDELRELEACIERELGVLEAGSVAAFRVDPGELRVAVEIAPEVRGLINSNALISTVAELVTRRHGRPPAGVSLLPAGALRGLPEGRPRAEECARRWSDGVLDGSAANASPAQSEIREILAPRAEPPRAGSEQVLAEIWGDVLRVPVLERDASFFALGGSSLAVSQALWQVKERFGVTLDLRRFFERPTLRHVAEAIDERMRRSSHEDADILAVPRAGRLPLSPAQRRMRLQWELQPESSAYNLGGALRLRGELDVVSLQASFDALVARHESLRTRFPESDGDAYQHIDEPSAVELQRTDLSRCPPAQREAAALDCFFAELRAPFDLARGPLLRVRLVSIQKDEHLLLVTVHHAIADGASVNVLIRELSILYSQRCQGQPPALPALPIQYADYAAWQAQRLEAGERQRQLQYWREQLGREHPVLELPADRPRPKEPSFRGASAKIPLDPALTSGVRELARAHDVSVFVILQAAYLTLLFRSTGERDLRVGIPTANRLHPAAAGVVGACINTQVISARLGAHHSVEQLLDQVSGLVVSAQAHQDLPFEQLVEVLQPKRSAAHHPLFQVMHNHQHRDTGPLRSWPRLAVELLDVEDVSTRFELSLNTCEDADGRLSATFVYAADIFDHERIVRMADQYRRLLEAMVSRPQQALGAIELMSAEEHSRVERWSRPAPLRASPVSPLASFEEQVQRQPDASALVMRDEVLTYAELQRRVLRLAAQLQGAGAGPDVVVAVALPRSIESVVAWLAVMRAGAAYLPLDPDLPAARLSYLIADSGARLVLARGRPEWAMSAEPTVAWIDADLPALRDQPTRSIAFPDRDAPAATHPEQLAYVLYTSGSTGMPKAVANTAGALARRLCWMQEEYGLCPGEVLLHKTPVGFDVAVWEVFWALGAGASLVVAAAGDERDPREIAGLVQRHHVTTLHFVPSLLKEFLALEEAAECLSLKRLFSGGEALTAELRRQVHDCLPAVRFDNRYGPTESLINVSYWTCHRDQYGAVPIGYPIPESTLHVLDAAQQPLPEGVPGELHIGGATLARGYLGRAALTAERFVPDPFSAHGGARLYRSGDWVKRRADGALEYLGRRDQQVKVRGVRVELGELEATLLQEPRVSSAAAAVLAGPGGAARLIAYVVCDDGLDVGSLRGALEQRLPAHLVPSQIVMLERMPLLPSGKLDRAALPEPEWQSEVYEAPATVVEQRVAQIWEEVLKVAPVGVQDDFFALGGHSLLGTQVVSRVRRDFGIELPLRALFEAPGLRGFARTVQRALDAGERHTQPPVDRVDRTRPLPLSYSQERMWFLWSIDPESAAYHVSGAVRLTGPLEIAALERALQALVARHEAFRTTFPRIDGVPRQVIAEHGVARLPIESLAHLPAQRREAEWRRRAAREANEPIDLEHGPLLNVKLLKLDAERHVLLVKLHHIVAEGWAMDIFAREYAALYEAFAAGKPSPLEPLPVQYSEFAVWQRKWLEGGEGARQLEYWRRVLGSEHPVLDFPIGSERPPIRSWRGSQHPFRLDSSFSRRIHAFGLKHGFTLQMTLVSALMAVLFRYTGQRDQRIGYPVANRIRPEFEGIIGAFLNTQVLRCELRAEMTLDDLLRRVKRAALEAQAHQDVPFHRIVEAVHPQRSAAYTPLFQVVCNVQRWAFQQARRVGELDVEFVVNDPDAARFDLELAISEVDGELDGSLRYSLDLFDAAFIERMVRHWVNVLEHLLAEPATPIGRVRMLDDSDVLASIGRVAAPAVDIAALALPSAGAAERRLPSGDPAEMRDCVARIEHHAQERPDSIAVACQTEHLSYRQLLEMGRRVAAALAELGVREQEMVGVLAPRSVELVVALLGILQRGAVYVPLDPRSPPQRVCEMVGLSRARVVLSRHAPEEELASALRTSTAAGRDVTVLTVAEACARPLRQPLARPAQIGTELAYVIYTSGSTGTPKGAMVEHAGLLNHLESQIAWFAATSTDVVAQTAPQTFDISIWQLLLPLLVGGQVAIMPDDVVRDALELLEQVKRRHVSIWQAVPTLIRVVLEGEAVELPSLRLMITTGEEISPELARQWLLRYPGVPLDNAYGPAECSDDVSLHRMTEPSSCDGARVSIGAPIENSEIYVLDAELEPLPRGFVGELCVSGVPVGRGYLGDPSGTARAFVPDPFSREPGRRMYRTGDLGRRRKDGLLEYTGRVDHQVKIRGHRIELGEIESRLCSHELVQQGAVVVRDTANARRLVAYVVARGERAGVEAELLEHLRRALPEYMVPSRVVSLDRLPLTPNGKIDRRALPEPDWSSEGDYDAPETDVERRLAEIWAQLLRVERVGRNSNFFELGGDSILSMQVVSRARAAGLALAPRDVFERPTVERLARAVRLAHEVASVQRPETGADAETPDRSAAGVSLPALTPDELQGLPVPAQSLSALYPLLPMQEGMLFHAQLGESRDAYVVQLRADVEGLGVERFGRAWQRVTERHAALRTSFAARQSGRGWIQLVHRSASVPLREVDYRGSEDAENDADQMAREERTRGFDLSRAPLQRIALARLSERRHRFIWTFHHAVLDGWSWARVIEEVSSDYFDEPLQAPACSFDDYLNWLQRRDESATQRFWQSQLLDLDEPTLLAGESAEGASTEANGRIIVEWSEAETAELREFARREQVTPSVVVQAAWSLLLQRHTGQRTVVFGATVAGRPAEVAGAESLVGLFINTVPIVAAPKADENVGAWLRRLMRRNLDVREHEHAPLYQIQRWAGRAGQPLFDTIVVFENYPVDRVLVERARHRLNFSGVKVEGTDAYPLVLVVHARERLMFEMVWSGIGEARARQLSCELQRALEETLRSAGRAIGALELTVPDEAAQIAAWSALSGAETPASLLHESFEAHAQRAPDAVAVTSREMTLTYGGLDAAASRLARELVAMGVSTDVLVGLCMDRCPEMVVAILAVLKAGGAYLPLDADYPAERLQQMLDEAGVTVVLTLERLLWRAQQVSDRATCIDRVLASSPRGLAGRAAATPAPQNLAYCIFTSGSTGRPKGVMISHESAVASTRARDRFYPDVVESFLLLSSFSFDSSVAGIFWTLSQGGRLCLPDAGALEDARALAEWAWRERVSHLLTLPSVWAQLVEDDDLRGLACAIVAGEPCAAALVQRHLERRPHTVLVNEYGPTEAAVWCTAARLSAPAPTIVPIGRPVASAQIHVLDGQLRPAAIGVNGELFVGGVAVARGYHRRPALTADRFIPNPFSEKPGERMYRTGDLVRYRSDGELEYRGRVDRQVKIRGYRIELGEIESRLLEHPSVRQAAVVARQGAVGKRLVAYVAASASTAGIERELLAHLARLLPEHMVPASIVPLDELPLMPNGKINHRTLPEPEASQREYEPPTSERERALAQIWTQLLRVPRVGRNDDFFELGGDSIVSMQMVARARALGLTVRLRDVFANPTIARLSQVTTVARAAAEQGEVRGRVELAPAQRRFFRRHASEPHHYNQALLLRPRQPLKAVALTQALSALLRHHDALRARYRREAGGQWEQQYASVEVGAGSEEAGKVLWERRVESEAELEAAAEEAQRSLDVERGPLLRAVLARLGDESERLLLVIHHLVVDGVSWRVLVEDLETAYRQRERGSEVELPAKTSSLQEWSSKLLEYGGTEELKGELGYWLEQLGEAGSVELPRDEEVEEGLERDGETVEVRLGVEETRRLLSEAPRAYRTQVNDVLLTALSRVMCRWSGRETLLIELEGHGREELFEGVDVSRTVGWFTSVFPVRLRPRLGGSELGEALKEVKEQLRRVPKRGVGYGVLKYLTEGEESRELRSRSEPRVTFNYLGQLEASAREGGLFELSSEGTGRGRSEKGELDNWLSINGGVRGGELRLTCTYSRAMYRRETVESVMSEYRRELGELIEHCTSGTAWGVTPSDVVGARIEQADIDAVLENL